MKRFFKIFTATLVILALLTGGALGVLYFGFGIDIFDQSGWYVTESGASQYLDYHGQPLTGWQLIDSKWYYFDLSGGNMHTGWLESGGNRYYLTADGTRCSGWLTLSDGTYYLSPTSGVAAVGWLSLDGQRHYLDADGRLANGWRDIDGARYFLSDEGTPCTGWLEAEDSRYYLNEDGTMATGWLEQDGALYYLDDDGAMYTGWLETEEGRRYLDDAGHLATGWTDTPEGRFYLDEEGFPATGWLETDGGTYYLDDTGAMTLGWLDTGDDRYYFREDGTMAVGKVLIDDVATYFTSTGAYILMVNKWNAVPEDYSPELVSFNGWKVSSECYDALVQMLTDMRKAGYTYEITSAYRSKANQQAIWDRRMTNYQLSGYSYSQALSIVSQSVAVPGTSEHHLGLAIDISGGHAWLEQHCWDYGFIVRYPDGKTSITGIIYEPWHYRYVGTDLAAELRSLGLCLEEYLDMLTEQAGNGTGSASDPELYTSCYSSAA